MALIDFNTLTSDPIKNLNAARVALRKTEFGRTGIVRAEFADDNRSVLFRLITTGKTYTSYQQALEDASASMVTRFTTALPYNRAASLMDPNNPKISQVGDVLFSIQQNVSRMSTSQIQDLERLGISKTIIDDITSGTRNLAIDLFQIKDQEEVRAKALDEIRRQIKREGNKNLLPFIDDEGGNLLRFKVTKAAGEVDDLVLTNAQVHYMLAAAGQPLLEPGMLDEVLAGNKSAQSLLQKLGKRMKGIFGERDLTIFAEDILGEFSGGKGKVDDTILVIEEGLDYLRKTVGIDARKSAIGLALENVDTNQSIKRSLERMGKANPEEFISTLFAEGSKARDVLGRARDNKELLTLLESEGAVSKDQLSSIKTLMDDVAQDFDGISALNIRTLKSARKRISAQLKLVMDQAERNPNDLQIQEQYAALRSQLDRINNADNLYQLTGRGLIGEGQVKTAFYVDKFSGELDNYSMILGRSATKGELGITGMSRFITLSGLGSPKDLVYADPGLIAFHPELFATEQGVKAMQEYSASVIQDFQQTLNQNILPQNVVTSLRKELETDITGLPEPVRLSKEKNRRFIQEILQLHQSGIGPRQSPEMMNLLANVYASRAFREETGRYGRMFLPVLPDTYRFAVSTESAAAISNKSFTPMLESGTQTTSFKISNERALKNIGATGADLTAKFDPSGTIMSQELLKFRIDNHRVLFAAGAVPEYFNALGGFDLDDKGLPRLMTYTDSQNRKRLMFSLTRQPTGAQETILARATLADTETLRNLYGDRDDFRKALRSLVSEGAGEEFNALETTLAGDSKLATMVGVNVDEAEYTMEKTILKVYEKMGRSIVDVEEDGGRTIYNIAKYGSSALKKDNAYAGYTRSGMRQIFAQEQSKAFNLIPFMDAAESSISQLEEVLPSGIADSLRRAMADNDSARFASILNSDSNSPGLTALKQMMFINRLSQGSESADILGVYINRSMVVGSTLNQFDDFLFEIMGNKAVKDFLTKDGIGLVAQEAAIDASVGFSLQKGFVAELASLTSETLDPDAAMRAIERLTGAAGGVTTLDKLGETAINLLGQRLGKMSKLYASRETLGLKFDESLRPVIDELIIGSRLSSSDRPKLLQGVITGLEQGQTTFGEDAETTNLLTRLKRVAALEDPEKITESLINIFGTKTGKYAAASTVQRLGETQQLMISEMEKLGLSRIMRDQVLSATQVADEAMNAAKVIIEKNKDDLTRLVAMKDLDLADSQLVELSVNKNLLSEKIISDFDSVKRITGLSTEELINATEKYSSRMGIKFPFDYIMTESQQAVDFVRQVAAARTRRMSRFIGDLSGTPAVQNIFESIESAKALTGSTYDQVAYLKSEIESGKLVGQEANIAQVLLGNEEAMAAMSEDELEAARRGSQSIFVKQQEAAISSEVSRALTEKPAAATAADTESVVGKTLKMVMDGESYEEAARKAKYKRIGDFIRDGSLKNLFDNKVFRNSVFAAGALIAGSFIYQGSKERTQESIEGPPLLPGGSAYEDYPQRAAQIPQIGTMSYNPGISYKVNLYGNRRDVSNFQQMAMGIGNFDMDTTMYSRIPEVGADPYQQLASSF